MTQFHVEAFERLPGAPGWVTLRLEGRWTGDLDALGPPELVIDDGRRDLSLPPTSGPGTGTPTSGQRLWRISFSAPEDALSGGKLAFAARLGETIVDLPRPSEPAARRSAAAEPGAAPAAAPTPPAAGIAVPAAGSQAELASRLARERDARRELERTLRETRDAAELAAREARERIAGYEHTITDLQRDLREARGGLLELDAMQRQLARLPELEARAVAAERALEIARDGLAAAEESGQAVDARDCAGPGDRGPRHP